MQINYNIADKIILRQLYLQRYATGYSNQIIKALQTGDRRVIRLIRDFEDVASDKDRAALSKGNRNNSQVAELLNGIESIINEQQACITELAGAEMLALAGSEVDHTYRVMESEAEQRPAASQIIRQAVLGFTGVAALWLDLFAQHLKRIITGVIDAVANGLEPVAVVRGTRIQRYRDGLIRRRDIQIEATANTQTTGVTSNARSAVYDRLGVKRELWLSTLDFRTTPICRARDGDVYKKGEGPHPPAHYRCRSVRIPYVDDPERPFVKDARPVKKIPKSERDGKIGQTRMTYDEWFARLNQSQQREILGPSRLTLYQSGKFSLDRFVDPRTGKQYTLKELDKLT